MKEAYIGKWEYDDLNDSVTSNVCQFKSENVNKVILKNPTCGNVHE